MKMKIPKSLNLFGHEYNISYQKEFDGTHKAECRYPSRKIVLAEDLKGTGELAWSYLLHEIKHGWQFETGLVQVLGREALEFDADQFASGIISLQKQKLL